MPNLNEHDLIFFKYSEFVGFEKYLEKNYQFRIISTDYPPYVSFTSRKAILHTDKGSFFLKEKPEYSCDKLSLDKSTRFQSYASSRLDIVPKIKLTKNDNCFVIWKNRFYFLTDYKNGRVFNGSDEDVSSMLKALNKLQKIGKEFADNKDVPSDVLKQIESFDIAKLVPLIKKYIGSKRECLIYERIIKCLEMLKTKYLSLPRNEYIMSHSDFIVFNLIFKDNEVVAINDFDNAKRLPSLHDLAEFLVSATMLNYNGLVTNMKLPVFLKPQKSKFKLIIKSYIQDFSLSKKDSVLLGTIAEIVWLWTLCLSVLKGDYKILDLAEAVKRIEKSRLSSLIKSTAIHLSE